MMLLIFLSITHLLNNTSLYQGLTWGKPNKQSFVFFLLIIIAYTASYYLTPKEPFVTEFTKGLSHEMAAVKIAATIIIFPLLEELVFRGIILSSFLNALGEKAGYIIGGLTVSVLFAVIHTVFIAHQNPNVCTFINFLWSKISKQRASFTNSTAYFLYRAWPIY